jgi:hypothetical protein
MVRVSDIPRNDGIATPSPLPRLSSASKDGLSGVIPRVHRINHWSAALAWATPDTTFFRGEQANARMIIGVVQHRVLQAYGVDPLVVTPIRGWSR